MHLMVFSLSSSLLKQLVTADRSWPIASSMKVGFGATQARRLLAAVEIKDRIGADRPLAELRIAQLMASKQPLVGAGRRAAKPASWRSRT
jgi:hypothetical protein